ncbi:MAG: hypothetical protein AB7G75_11930 [Candidatus Binatia bacterium]
MVPPFLPGYLVPRGIDLTPTFAPLILGLQVLLILLALGFAVYVWDCYLIDTPVAKAVYPRRFICPVKQQPVAAQFVAWKGQPWYALDVKRCSGWCLGTEKNCNKECLLLFEGPAPVPPSLVL